MAECSSGPGRMSRTIKSRPSECVSSVGACASSISMIARMTWQTLRCSPLLLAATAAFDTGGSALVAAGVAHSCTLVRMLHVGDATSCSTLPSQMTFQATSGVKNIDWPPGSGATARIGSGHTNRRECMTRHSSAYVVILLTWIGDLMLGCVVQRHGCWGDARRIDAPAHSVGAALTMN